MDLLIYGCLFPFARAGQTSVESAFRHSNGKVAHFLCLTVLIRQHAPIDVGNPDPRRSLGFSAVRRIANRMVEVDERDVREVQPLL